MGQILEPIMTRRARRAIADQPIEESTLKTLFQAAILAPSCANNQPWRFVAIHQEPALSQVKDQLSGGNYWAKRSPCLVAVASRADLDCQIPDGREYHLFGCGLASMNLMLQAEHLGLIAHPIAGFRQAPIKKLLGIPDDLTLITLIVLGHPTGDVSHLSEKHQQEEVAERSRHPSNENVFWNAYSLTPSTEE